MHPNKDLLTSQRLGKRHSPRKSEADIQYHPHPCPDMWFPIWFKGQKKCATLQESRCRRTLDHGFLPHQAGRTPSRALIRHPDAHAAANAVQDSGALTSRTASRTFHASCHAYRGHGSHSWPRLNPDGHLKFTVRWVPPNKIFKEPQ
jgi:hypothetical protein